MKKPKIVIAEGARLGLASSWTEVRQMLQELGLALDDYTFRVETPEEFLIRMKQPGIRQ